MVLAFALMTFMEVIVQKETAQTIAILMDFVKMENAIVTRDLQESTANTELAQMNAISKACVRKKVCASVTKDSQEVIALHHIALIIATIMVSVETTLVTVKINGLELIVLKNHVLLTVLATEYASKEYAIAKMDSSVLPAKFSDVLISALNTANVKTELVNAV